MSASSTYENGVPLTEYDRRWSATLDQMAEAGLDCICVTAKRSLQYYTGYDGRGADMAPFILIIAPDRPRTMVARLMDRTSIVHESIPLDVPTYFSGREDAIPLWAETLKKFDLGNARVGLELDNWDLAPLDVEDLKRLSPGVKIENASTIVSRLMDIKSDVEIDILRQAASITDKAYHTFYDMLAPG